MRSTMRWSPSMTPGRAPQNVACSSSDVPPNDTDDPRLATVTNHQLGAHLFPGGTFAAVITSVHLLIYSDDAPATRGFLRDVLGWPYVEDSGTENGWLIFGTGPSEMGVHPTRSVWEGKEYNSPRQHQISLMCDDLETTMQELRAKGATFSAGIRDEGYGLVTMLDVPGADPIQLYEPRHELAYRLERG
jgi:catechol 2,3-dioxygenase-like lactoylglutathione lyase family enzyme